MKNPTIYFPTREDIDALEVGDMAPNAFGELAEVVDVSARRDDIHGARFVCYSTRFGPTSSMTMSLKQDAVARTVALCNVLNSAEIDALEQRLRAARYVDGIRHPERVVRIDGEHECTLAELFAANDLDEEDVAALESLSIGETFTGGGGAAAEWTAERVR